MRLTVLLSASFLSTLAGCSLPIPRVPPAVIIPPVSEVAEVRLQSHGSSLKHVYDITLTKENDIAAVLDWLTQIDWSPTRASDLANVGLKEVGKITITGKDGSAWSVGLSGGMVIVNRWEWQADTDKLAEIAKQAGVKVP